MIKVYFSKSLQGEKYIAVSCVKRNMLSFRFVDKSVKINQFINLATNIIIIVKYKKQKVSFFIPNFLKCLFIA